MQFGTNSERISERVSEFPKFSELLYYSMSGCMHKFSEFFTHTHTHTHGAEKSSASPSGERSEEGGRGGGKGGRRQRGRTSRARAERGHNVSNQEKGKAAVKEIETLE